VYDLVIPFGDSRGDYFESVWTFDLDKDLIFLTKQDGNYAVPLGLARERLLTQDDFEPVPSPQQTLQADQTIPGPYWKPVLRPNSREVSFLGRVIRDFGFTWRHVLRRELRTTTFTKLAYAVIWMSKLEFTLLERVGFEYVTDGGPYVKVVDLPSWDAPDALLVPVGSSWFVLAQDIHEGLERVRLHATSQSCLRDSTTEAVTYAVLTLREVVLCKAYGDGLFWTRPEKLFHHGPPSDAAIELILSASRIRHQPLTINYLPIEVQDNILHHATVSLVAAAKLGCELGLGSPFSWVDRGIMIVIEDVKRHRGETSPVESHIMFNGVKSGLSYRRDRERT
jgi:hypothetical protein